MSQTPFEFAPGLVVQGITPPLRLADYKLIAFDMDSTLISIECVDEIADAAGRKAEVAAITEAAMQGLIADYKESLRQRVALLKGVGTDHLERVFTERLRFNPGAAELIAAAKAAGLATLLVSGGFTFFSDRVKAHLGIDFARSNVLEIENGLLTGREAFALPWADVDVSTTDADLLGQARSFVQRFAHAMQALVFDAHAAPFRHVTDSDQRVRIVGGELGIEVRGRKDQRFGCNQIVQIRGRLGGEHGIVRPAVHLRQLDFRIPVGALHQAHHQPAPAGQGQRLQRRDDIHGPLLIGLHDHAEAGPFAKRFFA